MATIQQSIEIKVPVHTAYNQLTQFEEYPRFMEEVESVRQVDDTHLHWCMRTANRPLEWDAEITEQEPDRYIAWHSISGPANTGKVEVQALGPDAAQVTVTLQAETEQARGSMMRISEDEMSRRLKQDLAHLKDFIEARGTETGGWRGEVHHAGAAIRDRSAAGAEVSADSQAAGAPPQQHLPTEQTAPVQMRHLGEMPQDTTAEQHRGVPTSDSMGKPMPLSGQGSPGAVNQMQPGGEHASKQPDTERPQQGSAAASPDNRAQVGGSGNAGVSAVVGAAGGTDAAAGARLSGNKGEPGGPSLRESADAAGVTGAPGGATQGNAVSPAAGADAAGRTGLGSAATADDTRTGTGGTSGSGTALTGGGMSGERDAGVTPGGVVPSKGNTPKR